MNTVQSPLDYLAAFTLVFVAGVLTNSAVRMYGRWMKDKGVALSVR